MNFLDPRERVLDIQLTQHGKRLLARGLFKPQFYAFFDDNILYDSEYGGIVENRNDAGERIRNETPVTAVQYVFSGIETDVKKAIELKRSKLEMGYDNGVMIQGTPEKHFATSAPLGNSSLGEDNLPSWSINLLQGEISGSVTVLTGSQPTVKIPQLNMADVTFKTTPVKPSMDSPEARGEASFGDFGNDGDGTVSDLNFASTRFEDGSFIKIEEDFLLFEVKEENVDFLDKNFDIEIFMEEIDPKTNQNIFTPLSFDMKQSLVVNDVLIDQEGMLPLENRSLDPSYVDHFFHVYVDNEISKDVLCRLVPGPLLEASFPADFLDCDRDFEARVADNTLVVDAGSLYDSDVTETDLDDEC